MSLETLPPEILSIIFRKLDTKSAHNLYEACQHARRAISVPGTIEECQFSLNTLATAQSLRSHFFLDIASNLKVLNLSGVHDLTSTSFKQAVRELKKLTSLDVSYTNIVLPDYIDIYEMLPELKTLAINYNFGEECIFSEELFNACQESFKNLKNIHFVGAVSELLNSDVPLWLLSKADLDCLTMTMISKEVTIASCPWGQFQNQDCSVLEVISSLKMFFMPTPIYHFVDNSTIFQHLDIIKYEMLIFESLIPEVILGTQLLGEFIQKKFQTVVIPLTDLNSMDYRDAACMFWNKKSTRFDDNFFSRLTSVVNDYMPYCFKFGVQWERPSAPPIYKSYLVHHYCLEINNFEAYEAPLNNRIINIRQGQPCFVLNYDEVIKNKEKGINLEVHFKLPYNIPLRVTIKNCDFLSILTHLTLYGKVLYTTNFFKELFENAKSLETLEITYLRGNFLVMPLLKLMPQCKSLKNFLLNTKMSKYGTLFYTLSYCKNLENIYLINLSKAKVYLPNPKYLFSKCFNLYSFTFQKDMPERQREKALALYERVRSDVGKPALSIRFLQYTEHFDNQYTPMSSMYNKYRLKPN